MKRNSEKILNKFNNTEDDIGTLLEKYNLARYNTIQGRHILPRLARILNMSMNEFLTSTLGTFAMKSFNKHAREIFGDDPEKIGAPNTDDQEWNPDLDKEGNPMPQAQNFIDKMTQMILTDILRQRKSINTTNMGK